MKGKTHDLNHDLTFSAHSTINCVCHSIRSMIRVYNFDFRQKVRSHFLVNHEWHLKRFHKFFLKRLMFFRISIWIYKWKGCPNGIRVNEEKVEMVCLLNYLSFLHFLEMLCQRDLTLHFSKNRFSNSNPLRLQRVIGIRVATRKPVEVRA